MHALKRLASPGCASSDAAIVCTELQGRHNARCRKSAYAPRRSRLVCTRVASLERPGLQVVESPDRWQRLTTVPLPSGPAGTDDLQEQDVQPEARAVGAVLGAMCGNVLGAPVRHERHWQVARKFPNGLTEFWAYDLGNTAVQEGEATGEFQMLMATAHALVLGRCIDARVLAMQLCLRCDLGSRVYSPHSAFLIETLQQQPQVLGSLRTLAQVPLDIAHFYAMQRARKALSATDRWDREPWGPADHSAAVVFATPIALAYRGSAWNVVESAINEACLISHTHPVGIDGARVMAAAVHWLLQQPAPAAVGSGRAVGPQALLDYLMTVASTADMRSKLQLLQQHIFQVDSVTTWQAMYRSQQWHKLTQILSRITYHDLATSGTEAVAVALWAFCTHWHQPRQAVCVAATFAGSAPATSQMVGALAGALHGYEWIPDTWLAQLENDEVNVDRSDESASPSPQATQSSSSVQSSELDLVESSDALGLRDEALLLAEQLAMLGCTQVGLENEAQWEDDTQRVPST